MAAPLTRWLQTSPGVWVFFDELTNTVSYIVFDHQINMAAVIDAMLDFDHRSGEASTRLADKILSAGIFAQCERDAMTVVVSMS